MICEEVRLWYEKVWAQVERASAMEYRLRYPLKYDALSDEVAVLEKREREKKKAGVTEREVGLFFCRMPCAASVKRVRLGKGALSLKGKKEKSYAKWSKRFAEALRAGDAPAWGAAQASDDPGRFLDGLLGSVRATTVGLRARAWERLVRWLKVRKLVSWPQEDHHIIDYMWDELVEKPSPTFPRTLLAALTWMESRAGIPEAERLHLMDSVRRTVDKATADM